MSGSVDWWRPAGAEKKRLFRKLCGLFASRQGEGFRGVPIALPDAMGHQPRHAAANSGRARLTKSRAALALTARHGLSPNQARLPSLPVGTAP